MVTASFTGWSVTPSPVHEHVRGEAAVGELREGRPRAPLRVAQELVQVVNEGGGPVLRHQRLDPMGPQTVRRRLARKSPEISRVPRKFEGIMRKVWSIWPPSRSAPAG